MSEYTKQEIEIVTRTKEIINQYSSSVFWEKYEVTLFINCFV